MQKIVNDKKSLHIWCPCSEHWWSWATFEVWIAWGELWPSTCKRTNWQAYWLRVVATYICQEYSRRWDETRRVTIERETERQFSLSMTWGYRSYSSENDGVQIWNSITLPNIIYICIQVIRVALESHENREPWNGSE